MIGNLAGEKLQGEAARESSAGYFHCASVVESDFVCCFCHSDVKMCASFENRRGMVSRISYECKIKNCKIKGCCRS